VTASFWKKAAGRQEVGFVLGTKADAKANASAACTIFNNIIF
jgi:hypothetical protein